jgi:DNA-binding transcriptional MerR regulator
MKLEHRRNRYERCASRDNADRTGQKENDHEPEHLNTRHTAIIRPLPTELRRRISSRHESSFAPAKRFFQSPIFGADLTLECIPGFILNSMAGNGTIRALRSGEVAKTTGVSSDTLRHYEKLGLLPAPVRSQGGYRLYPADTVALVQMIRSAVRVGFSLAQLADVLKERRVGGAPCRKVAQLAAEHIEALNQKIVDLTQLRDWLTATVEDWESRLTMLNAGERASLLESLPKPHELDSIIMKGNKHEADSIGVPRARLDDRLRAGHHAMPHARRRP